jgi:uncharacterized membrane protein YoaK (UPF0700 family)
MARTWASPCSPSVPAAWMRLASSPSNGALPSAMTGNTALLGLALGQGHPAAAAPPLAAGAGFVLGAALASALLHLDLAKLSTRRTVAWLLAVEACLLRRLSAGLAVR